MSEQSKVYTAGLAVAVALGLLGSLLVSDDRITVLQPTFLGVETALSLQSQPRQWKTPVFRQAYLHSRLLDALFIKPGLEGEVFVFDWGNMHVKRFSRDGTLLSEFGGKGNGLGEFINPTDMAIRETGEVVITDPKKGLVTIFGRDGKPATPLQIVSTPCRIDFLRDGLVVGMVGGAADNLFELYDAEGRRLRSCGQFIKDQSDNSICLDGWVVVGAGDVFVYVALYAGIIASYDRDGKLRFLVGTIDGPTLPAIEVTSLGSRRLPLSTPRSAECISVTSEKIYIMKSTDHDGSHVKSMDVYSLTDGAYQYSFELPEQCTRALVTDSSVYTLARDTLAKWEWKQP